MKDGSLLTSAAKPSSEQWITHNPARGMAEISRTRDSSTVFQRTCREPAPPDNVKLVASWQRGVETLSGLRQWKLRLQFIPSAMGAARSARPWFEEWSALRPSQFWHWTNGKCG